MRIALTDFHNDWGGQPLQVLLLARTLSENSHDVYVMAPEHSELAVRCAQAGISVYDKCTFRRGFRPLTWFRDLHFFCRFVKTNGIQVVHCHGSQDTWLASLARLITRMRYAIVRTKHNSYPVSTHFFNRWVYGKAIDRLITVAGPIRDYFIQNDLVSPDRVQVIHAGLDDKFISDVPTDASVSVRREFNLDKDALVIGLVGRLAKDKGQDVLFRALPEIRKQIPAVHALLIGTGGDYGRQNALCAEMGLETCVTFTLFREDIARLTAACNVCILAATDCDASSTVLKEAMALGVPVVGTDVGGTREILDDGRCGSIIPPDDPSALARAIVETLVPDDKQAIASQVESARTRVESEYSMAAVAAATLRVYEEAKAARSQ